MVDQRDPDDPTGAARTGLDGTVDITRDRALVERCQAGDQAAFGELYTRYRRRLVTFCQRRLRDPHEAEDAAQEAFARAWRAIPTFSGERRFYPWLTVIARNVCTDVARKRARSSPVADVPLPAVDPGVVDVDEAIIAMADATMAAEALDHVSERHRRVLRLREGSGWTTERLAEHEGMAVPAVETLLWRARQSLKREFAALADTGGRLGVAIGFGLAALRRFVWRSAARVADRLPVLQSLSPSLRSPVAVVAGLALAGGIVGGTVAAVASSTPKAPVNATALSAPGGGGGNLPPLQGSTSATAPAGGSASGSGRATTPGSASGSGSTGGTSGAGGAVGATLPGVSVPGGSAPVGGSSSPGDLGTVAATVVTPVTKDVITPVTKDVVTPVTKTVLTTVSKSLGTGGDTTVGPAVPTVSTAASKATQALTTTASSLGTTLTTVLNPLGTLGTLASGGSSSTHGGSDSTTGHGLLTLP